ncbi:50S ribosomal protein L6 [Bacteroidota bacterium]|nr:50S ribosomal protein L6 [Bacteroidota bacterium]
MSRIGNSIIKVPEGVTLDFTNGLFTVKGKLGELSLNIDNNIINIDINEQEIKLTREDDSNNSKSIHGLTRALIFNMVTGVTEGFTKKLELIGVGYRASNQGQLLDISVGFSHNIVFEVPVSVKLTTETEKGKAPIITLTSINKQLLGHVAAKIRSFRKPEPYKGKGIRYVGEFVRKKAGKTAAA